MMLTANEKKAWHMIWVAFVGGLVSYISSLAVSASLPGIRAIITGVVVAFLSRLGGMVLANQQTAPPTVKP